MNLYGSEGPPLNFFFFPFSLQFCLSRSLQHRSAFSAPTLAIYDQKKERERISKSERAGRRAVVVPASQPQPATKPKLFWPEGVRVSPLLRALLHSGPLAGDNQSGLTRLAKARGQGKRPQTSGERPEDRRRTGSTGRRRPDGATQLPGTPGAPCGSRAVDRCFPWSFSPPGRTTSGHAKRPHATAAEGHR